MSIFKRGLNQSSSSVLFAGLVLLAIECGGVSSSTPSALGGGQGQAGARSVSTDAGQGGAAAGAASEQDSAGAAGCVDPSTQGCPVGFLELEGRPVNPTEQCLEPGLPVSCSRGGSPLLSCWVDSSTDTVYSVDYIGCMANPKWVKCSDMLQSMVASVTADCEH
jgi:hypothetical protein